MAMGSHGELANNQGISWHDRMDREAPRKDVDQRLEEVNKLVEARVSTW